MEGGGDASKRRRAQGHCKFELRDSTVATDADMECAPTCWPFGAWRLAGGLPERQALFSRITLRAASTVQAAGGDSVGLGPSDVQGHNCARLALTQLAALAQQMAQLDQQIPKHHPMRSQAEAQIKAFAKSGGWIMLRHLLLSFQQARAEVLRRWRRECGIGGQRGPR